MRKSRRTFKGSIVAEPDVCQKRARYLRKIEKKRLANRSILYLDETWVDTCCYPSLQWKPPKGEPGRKLPTGRGQRFVILHCGSKEMGFVPKCELVIKATTTDGRDYHTEMNGDIFEKWVEEQLAPSIPASSVIVLDTCYLEILVLIDVNMFVG